jgi:hypothetical protein
MQILLSRLQSSAAWLLLLLPVVFLASCDKDLELDDSSMNPGGVLNLSTVDSLRIIAYTTPEIPLDGKNQSVTPLGSIQETRFGAMYASFYANLRLTTIGFAPAGNIVADSAFLILRYNATYGSKTQPLNIKVYELDEALVAANTYRNNTTLNTKSTPIGELNNFTIPADSGTIKIPLTMALAERLIGQFGTSVYASNDNFQNFFKGIYVTTQTSGGDGLAYLQLTNTQTMLRLHFTSSTVADSEYRLMIDNQATRVNRYTTDFEGSEVETAINISTGDDEDLYVSAFSGTKAIVKMPEMPMLENAIINNATLTFYQLDFQTPLSNDFPAPDNLFMFLNLPDSSLALLPGVSLNNITDFGGLKRQTTVNGIATNEYTFNITKFLQDYIDGNAPSESIILSVLSVNSGARVKVGGGSHPYLPARLKVVYTSSQ